MYPPKNDKDFKELADEMIDWFKEENNIYLEKFCGAERISCFLHFFIR